jgi:hypothetical protein
MTKKTGPITTAYSWFYAPDGIECYQNPLATQTVTRLWESTELTDFHDAELAKATKEINAIFGALEKNNKDPNRKLSLIGFENHHLLIWAGYGAIGPDDDEKTVVKALKLKVK